MASSIKYNSRAGKLLVPSPEFNSAPSSTSMADPSEHDCKCFSADPKANPTKKRRNLVVCIDGTSNRFGVYVSGPLVLEIDAGSS